MSALLDSIGSNIVPERRSYWERLSGFTLVLQNRKLVPVGVVEGVRLGSFHVRLGQEDADLVDEWRVLCVVDHQLRRLFVFGEGVLGFLDVGSLDERVQLCVGIA